MLSLSKNGPIDELIAAVQGLPDKTESVPEEFGKAVKALAVQRLEAVRTPAITHAHINVTANVIGPMHAHQCMVAVMGRRTPPKPVEEPTPDAPPDGTSPTG
jgi:hypothetical protein